MLLSITLCFFEHPGALQEIKLWHDCVYKEVVQHVTYKDSSQHFLLTKIMPSKYEDGKSENYLEYLYCLPTRYLSAEYDFNVEYFVEKIKKDAVLASTRYQNAEYKVEIYKHLIFGKVNKQILSKIVEVIDESAI